MLRHRAERVQQRRALLVGIDEQEAPPAFQLHFGQGAVEAVDVGEIPMAGYALQPTVHIPFPGVIRATDGFGGFMLGTEHGSTMQAAVMKGFDFIRGGADDEPAKGADLKRHPVADVRDIFLTPGEQPVFCPDMILFGLCTNRGEIAVIVDMGVVRFEIALRDQRRGGGLMRLATPQLTRERAFG